MSGWRLDGDSDSMTLDVIGPEGRIAMIDCENFEITDEELGANARLIAAAPELLAALEEMNALFADHAQYDEEGHETAAIKAAQAAIAKAKGADQ